MGHAVVAFFLCLMLTFPYDSLRRIAVEAAADAGYALHIGSLRPGLRGLPLNALAAAARWAGRLRGSRPQSAVVARLYERHGYVVQRTQRVPVLDFDMWLMKQDGPPGAASGPAS